MLRIHKQTHPHSQTECKYTPTRQQYLARMLVCVLHVSIPQTVYVIVGTSSPQLTRKQTATNRPVTAVPLCPTSKQVIFNLPLLTIWKPQHCDRKLMRIYCQQTNTPNFFRCTMRPHYASGKLKNFGRYLTGRESHSNIIRPLREDYPAGVITKMNT